MKIEGMKGDSNVPSHEGEIELLSVSHKVASPAKAKPTGQVRTANDTDHTNHELVVTSPLSTASPKLFEAAVTGRHLPKAVITFISTSPSGKVSEYLVITMSDVLVTNVSPSVFVRGQGGDVPTAQDMTLNYGKIEWEYKPIDEAKSTGPVKTSFDLKSHK
jgi:type VI secretion system secreted protein Hcp